MKASTARGAVFVLILCGIGLAVVVIEFIIRQG